LVIEEGNVIISASQKGEIQIMPLDLQFEDIKLKIGDKYPISCLKIKDKFDSTNIRLFFGTMDEQVVLFTKGWLSENFIPIHKDKKSEVITNIDFCQGVVVWSTKSDIKIRDIITNK
jgi:hypothetical protein